MEVNNQHQTSNRNSSNKQSQRKWQLQDHRSIANAGGQLDLVRPVPYGSLYHTMCTRTNIGGLLMTSYAAIFDEKQWKSARVYALHITFRERERQEMVLFLGHHFAHV